MENISYIGLSRQIVLKRQMDVTANNIANMTTPGFKTQKLLFEEHLSKAGRNDMVSQVSDFATYRVNEQGPLSRTGNDLDVAIQGNGYFAVQDNGGNKFYTRAGSFALNENGELVTQHGYLVLDDGGSPISIPSNEGRVTIAEDGTIATQNGTLGVLGVNEFDNEQNLIEVGRGMYDAGNEVGRASETAKTVQGMLEGSNVNAITEMNNMIDISRAYQSTQKMLQNDHERQRNLIAKLSKLN